MSNCWQSPCDKGLCNRMSQRGGKKASEVSFPPISCSKKTYVGQRLVLWKQRLNKHIWLGKRCVYVKWEREREMERQGEGGRNRKGDRDGERDWEGERDSLAKVGLAWWSFSWLGNYGDDQLADHTYRMTCPLGWLCAGCMTERMKGCVIYVLKATGCWFTQLHASSMGQRGLINVWS